MVSIGINWLVVKTSSEENKQLIGNHCIQLSQRSIAKQTMDRRQFERREKKSDRRRHRNSNWDDRKNHADLIERSIIGKITFLLLLFFPSAYPENEAITYRFDSMEEKKKKRMKKVEKTESYSYNYD